MTSSRRVEEEKKKGNPLFTAVVRPIQAFLAMEAAGGIILLSCAVIALALANSGASDAYRAILNAPIVLRLGSLAAEFTPALLVNDGLMTIFFFLVGMEIKRELAIGELRTLRQALLPLVAAFGGMVVPAAIFIAFNHGTPAAAGWGVPMATDIAFCIGVLTLLRSRVSHALVVFITALAIFDDIGGILVIAIFYGHGLHVSWLLIAAALTGALVLMGRSYIRNGLAYAALTAALWYALHHGGIHATIAGVIAGLAIPARARRMPRMIIEDLSTYTTSLLKTPADDQLDEATVLAIEEKIEDVESPLARFVHALHPWVAFVIMPVFALANSGVDLRALEPSQITGNLAVGIGLGLLVGKLVGIFSCTWVAVRIGLSPMPGGATLGKLVGVSTVAGIGFTVALFIAGLAYPGSPELLDQAKVGILGGSLIAGIVGSTILMFTRPVTSRAHDERQLAAAP